MTLGVSVESQPHIVFQLGGKIQIAFHPVPLQLCPATCYIPPPSPDTRLELTTQQDLS